MDLELRVSALESMVNRLAEENTALQEKNKFKVSKDGLTSEVNIEVGHISIVFRRSVFDEGTSNTESINIINLNKTEALEEEK